MTDAIYTNTAEGGADNVAVTTANSGGASGTAFASMGGSTTQIVCKATAAKAGSLGYQITLDATARYVRGDDPRSNGSPGTRAVMGFWFHWNGVAPGSTLFLASMRDSGDVAQAVAGVFTNGTVRAGAGSTLQAGSAVTLPSAGWYRVQLAHTPGGTAAQTTIELKVWDSTGTQVGSSYNSGATLTAGNTNVVSRFRFGAATLPTGSTQTVLWLDNLRWGNVASGDIGDISSPPSLVVTTEELRFFLDVRDSTGVGTLTYSIAYASGIDSSAGILEPVDGFFVIPATLDGASAYNVTVSNGTDTDTYEVTVPTLDGGGTAPVIRLGGTLMMVDGVLR
jgi:hypothetical protein